MNDLSSGCENNGTNSDSLSTGNGQSFWGKYRLTKWAKTVLTRNSTKVREQNIIYVATGMKGEVKNCMSLIVFYYSYTIIQFKVLYFVQIYTLIMELIYSFVVETYLNKTDENEIKCLLGLLIIS